MSKILWKRFNFKEKISFSMKSKSFSQTYRWLGRARTVAWFRNAFNVPNTSRGAKSNSNRERIRTQCNDKKLLEKNNTVVQNESNWSWNRHRSTLIPKKHCVIPWETVRAGKEIICITKLCMISFMLLPSFLDMAYICFVPPYLMDFGTP